MCVCVCENREDLSGAPGSTQRSLPQPSEKNGTRPERGINGSWGLFTTFPNHPRELAKESLHTFLLFPGKHFYPQRGIPPSPKKAAASAGQWSSMEPLQLQSYLKYPRG